MDPWNKGKEDFAFRLVMRFDEREKRPIYYYSVNKEEVIALKNYCEFCKKKQFFIEDNNSQLTVMLEQLLAINFYTTMFLPLNAFYELMAKLDAKSVRVGTFLSSFSKGLGLLKENKKHFLRAWAKAKLGKSTKSKPKTSLRVRSLLKTVIHFKKPTETEVRECAKKIGTRYKIHVEKTDSVKRKDLIEAVGRKKNGTDVKFIFSVHPEIMKYATLEVKLPEEHVEFCKFDFPKEDIPEVPASIVVDTLGPRILITSTKFSDVTPKEVQLSDISSVVLNNPPEKAAEGHFWLRINGRKIKKELDLGKITN